MPSHRQVVEKEPSVMNINLETPGAGAVYHIPLTKEKMFIRITRYGMW
jgi:hypothetical protein